MLELYYKIWVDAIVFEKSKKINTRNWKLYTLVPMSIIQGVNLLTFFYWMKTIVNHNLPLFFTVNIFNARLINAFISIILTLIIPFVILNYLLILSNNRYEDLVEKYNAQNGKLYKRYFLISLGLLIIPVLLQKFFFQIV